MFSKCVRVWFDVYYLFIGLILISRITGTKRDTLLLTDILLYNKAQRSAGMRLLITSVNTLLPRH